MVILDSPSSEKAPKSDHWGDYMLDQVVSAIVLTFLSPVICSRICRCEPNGELVVLLEDFTGYKIDYIAILGDPENSCKLLKIMVGERGFEPPTPWSRISFCRFIEIY